MATMEHQRHVRRHRRRRRHHAAREASAWITLLFVLVRKIYHWAMLFALVAFVILVGLAYPFLHDLPLQ